MSNQITGTVVGGRYKITGYLRDGRMGNVYVSRRVDDQGMVAIKLLDPALFGNEEAMRRFEREIRVLSRIRHPNSTAVYDAGRTESGLPWLAMEYFDGDLLSEVVEDRERLPADQAVQIAGQIAMALEVAHDLGIVHRDLSPENIMVVEAGESPRIKVLDFGLAGVADQGADEDTSLTAVGIRVGTPFYMAPEYIEDFECDHRADLYALGIVLYEMITGEPPFTGRPYRVMDRHVNEVPPRLSTCVDGVPPWLDQLAAQLLEKKPADRPPSAAAVVAAIERGARIQLQPAEPAPLDLPPPSPSRPPQTPAPAPVTARPAPAPAAASSNADPVLDRLRSRIIKSVDRRTGAAPAARDCLVVERVSEFSMLGEYGIQPGTLVHMPDQDQGLLDPTLLRSPVEVRRYVFHTSSGEQVQLQTTPALLGVDLVRSVDNIRTYYNPANDGDQPLLELWKHGAWDVLERLSERVLSSGGGLAGGLFKKLISGARPKAVNDPATLFYGAALIEQGQGDEGYPYILEFKKSYATHWPDIYLAIATAYAGIQRLQSGRRDLGIQLLQDSYQLEPLTKIGRALEKTTGTMPEARQLYQKRFPDYDLYQTDGRPGASLAGTLASMDDSQVLLVALLGGFRGNLRYNEFMMRYLNYAGHFSEFVAGLHVATTVKDRTSAHPNEWFVGEDLAVQAGLPVMVLEDFRAFVQREAKPRRIPTVYALNRDGVVVHEGLGLPVDLWNALGRAGQLRMNKLHASP